MKKRDDPIDVAIDDAILALGDPDPNRMLLTSIIELACTRNPYYAWQAIGNCIKHNKKFPDLIIDYLAMCAERMQSPRAEKSRDLRQELPWILDFPQKRGPGNMLNPGGKVRSRATFAVRFAFRIRKGEPPVEAMRNACNDTFDADDAAIDDKTLRRWLLEQWGPKEWPRTNAEWVNIIRQHMHSILEAQAVDPGSKLEDLKLKTEAILQRTKSRGTLG
jgi:hypothetical protein